MRYKVNVEVTETYEVIVEADSEEHAEETALNMEYDGMRYLDGSAEATVVETVTPKPDYYVSGDY